MRLVLVGGVRVAVLVRVLMPVMTVVMAVVMAVRVAMVMVMVVVGVVVVAFVSHRVCSPVREARAYPFSSGTSTSSSPFSTVTAMAG